MANLVEVYCKKCGENFKLNIGAHTKEEVIDMLQKQETFSCPGQHVEITSPLRYWEINWDSLKEEQVPTEEEWISDFKAKHEAYTKQEIEEKFEVVDFAFSMLHTIDKKTREDRYFDFVTSPKGKRLYY
jgi:hypothetical protein